MVSEGNELIHDYYHCDAYYSQPYYNNIIRLLIMGLDIQNSTRKYNRNTFCR